MLKRKYSLANKVKSLKECEWDKEYKDIKRKWNKSEKKNFKTNKLIHEYTQTRKNTQTHLTT